ncbi:putative transmembrane protein [Apostichopus japonicus]|uniref:Putative transmembrane protein n=1 Tax=Stichopus japonicus TaxID=307972 RepID=A0A2G8JZ50_STIJA|nr:putative transmembrane protein [Apostichopus japonicus]
MESRLYDGADVQTPLFGEQQPRDRVINGVISVLAILIVTSTLLSAIFTRSPSIVLNIALAAVVLMVCAGNITLVYWYRQGDIDPKFRRLIYFNALTIILLSICANFYIFKDNCQGK